MPVAGPPRSLMKTYRESKFSRVADALLGCPFRSEDERYRAAFGTLPKVAGEKESVRPTSTRGGKEPEVGEAMSCASSTTAKSNTTLLFFEITIAYCPRHRHD